MERRMRGNSHVRCGVGEKAAITSKPYLSLYPDFNAKISIRADHSHDFESFKVATYGLCISCGCETSDGLYCSDCDPDDDHEFCQECEQACYETWEVINYRGDFIRVCARCLDNYYRFCEHCEEYHPKSEFTTVADGSSVCQRCLENDFALCNDCDQYFLADELVPFVDSDGKTIYLCESCLAQKEASA